jgi:hypothetical protein
MTAKSGPQTEFSTFPPRDFLHTFVDGGIKSNGALNLVLLPNGDNFSLSPSQTNLVDKEIGINYNKSAWFLKYQ